jgi:enoyl-CoA hydratase/carnithine racemase
MGSIQTDLVAECVRIRLSCGPTNAFTTEVIEELTAEIARAQSNARGIFLCGGDKFFSNGVDLEWALTQSSAQMRTLFLSLGHLLLSVLESPIPVVGAIKGHAIGGAMALLLACDYRFAAKGRVLVGKPEILLGVPNPYYGDQLLRFVAGDFVASDLIYTGKLVEAQNLIDTGIIHEVAEAPAIEPLAWKKLAFLRDLAPEAFAESKRMRVETFCADVRAQLSSRVARQVEIWNTPDAQIRLRAAAQRLAR